MNKAIVTIVLCLGLHAATAAESPPSQAALGVWKRADGDGAGHRQFRIAASTTRVNTEPELYTAIDDRDGKAVVRIAGTDIILAVVTLLDHDTADFFFPDSRAVERFTRTVELEAKDLFGFWVTHENNDPYGKMVLLEFGDGVYRHVGVETLDVRIEALGGMYRVEVLGPRKAPALLLVPTGDGRLRVVEKGLEHSPPILRRATDNERTAYQVKLEMERNEADAVTSLRDYITAQTAFQTGNYSRLRGINLRRSDRQYCDNYRNLFYAKTGDGNPLSLIPKACADAFAGDGRGGRVPADAARTPTPYKGYLFLEDPAVRSFQDQCALVAYPAMYNRTGSKILWVDTAGVIYEMNMGKRKSGAPGDGSYPTLIAPEESPYNAPELWHVR